MSVRLAVIEPAEGIQIVDFEVESNAGENTAAKTILDYFPPSPAPPASIDAPVEEN